MIAASVFPERPTELIIPVLCEFQVLEYDRKIIADDRVQIEVVDGHEPVAVSPYGDGVFGFEVIRTSIHQVWLHHNVTVAPGEAFPCLSMTKR